MSHPVTSQLALHVSPMTLLALCLWPMAVLGPNFDYLPRSLRDPNLAAGARRPGFRLDSSRVDRKVSLL